MRALGVTAAAVIGFFVGMVAVGLLLMAAGVNESAQQYGTLLGAIAGGIGLGWLVARLIPAKPSQRRDHGRDVMQGRDQRTISWRR